MPWRHFELKSGKSSKFWSINQTGKDVAVHFGRVGTQGQKKTMQHPTSAGAKFAVEKLISEKTGKGYVSAKPAAAGKTSAKTTTSASEKRNVAKTAFNKLPANETLTFVGLVGPTGSGGVEHDRREGIWTFTARFAAWKVPGGPMVQEALHLHDSNINDPLLAKRMDQFPRLEIVKFSARKKRYRDGVGLELEKFLGKSRDEQLSSVAQKLEEPIRFKDPDFGVLQYDRALQFFEAKDLGKREDMSIAFNTKSLDEAKQMVQLSKPFWRGRKKLFKEFQQAVLKKMFETSASWYADANDGEVLTKKKFLEFLGNPAGIEFYLKNGTLAYTLGGESEELFGDHGVSVSGTLEDGIEDVWSS